MAHFYFTNSLQYIGTNGVSILHGTAITEPIYTSGRSDGNNIFIYMPRNYTGAYEIPNDIKIIVPAAFQYCSEITEITIPNATTQIHAYAFDGCTKLTTIGTTDNILAFDSNITTLGNYAFNNCPAILNV